MARKITSVILLLLLTACGAKKRIPQTETPHISIEGGKTDSTITALPEQERSEAGFTGDTGYTTSAATINEVINTAMEYSGVRYKYGGTSEKGMDCSGLLYVAFRAHDIPLPRISHEMAEEGRRIRVNEVSKGDLLFFTTTRRGRKINHVGLVVAVEGDDIKFIHSTTSRGVIVSSLREGFWNYSFVKATRVL